MSSSMIQVVVEGKSEEVFIREILAPLLSLKGLDVINPTLIGKSGKKGGDVRFDRAKENIGKHLLQRPDTYVTTMFDYYGINKEWPGIKEINHLSETGIRFSSSDKAKIIEEATHKSIIEAFPTCNATKRFVPYIQMYEFEALLYSDISLLAEKTGIRIQQLKRKVNHFDTPEEINDNPASAPSKLITKLLPTYKKVVMGTHIAETTGIDQIRQRCPHFNDWLNRLENLKIL